MRIEYSEDRYGNLLLSIRLYAFPRQAEQKRKEVCTTKERSADGVSPLGKNGRSYEISPFEAVGFGLSVGPAFETFDIHV